MLMDFAILQTRGAAILSDSNQFVLIAIIYRIFSLAFGFAFGVLGYKLYVKGVFDKSQEVGGRWGSMEVIMKNVAPGVVFAVAGIIIAGFGVVRPISVEHTSSE